MIIRFALISLILVGGCKVGQNVAEYPPANSPAGVGITVTLSDRSRIDGELLTVSADELALLVDDELVSISAGIIRRLKPEVNRTSLAVNRKSLSENTVTRLRPLSRFPAGIPEAALKNMLKVRGQTSIRVVNLETSQ